MWHAMGMQPQSVSSGSPNSAANKVGKHAAKLQQGNSNKKNCCCEIF